jgi:hypothetical protein
VDADLLRRVRDSLPRSLNAGILMGDGGFCILGWTLTIAGYHPITIYGSTLAVNDARDGGSAVTLVARLLDLPEATVRVLAELNDTTPGTARVDAVRARLDELLADA